MNSLYIAFWLVKRLLGKGRHVVFLLLVPALAVSLFIMIIQSYSSDKISVEVVNLDRGPLGAVLIEEWKVHHEILVRMNGDRSRAEELVLQQKAEAAVIIPENYTGELLEGRKPKIELKELKWSEAAFLVHHTVQTEAVQLTNTVQRTIRSEHGKESDEEAILKIYREKQEKASVYRMEQRDYLLGQRVSTSTGLFLIFIMVSAMATMSVIQEDKRSMTLQRLMASPVRRSELMAGHFLGCMLVGTVQILFVLAVTRLPAWGDYGISFGAQWLVLECFLLASLGMFAAVAGLMRGSERNSVVQPLILTPTCMVGGCFWPLEIMPESMQKLANFVPQKWVIDAVTRLSSGAGLMDIPYHLGILIMFGVVLLSFGMAVLEPDASGKA